MAKCRYPLEESEVELGTWTTNLIIPDVGRYVGDLTITDQRVIFLSKFDTSLGAIIDKIAFETVDEEQYMIIPRSIIQKVTPKKGMLNKRVILMTEGDDEFIIDYGMLSIDKIVNALENR